jgi:hypothetical protein
MAYLQPQEYENYGLPAGTSTDWVTAATALINSFCRRPDLNITQYTERTRMVSGTRTFFLSYLPLKATASAQSAIVSIEGRYGQPRRDDSSMWSLAEIATAFSVPGSWIALDASTVDYDASSGEVYLGSNAWSIPFNEISVVYTAGLAEIGDDIKSACAQIVRNAQATPALNASKTRLDSMQIQYFSSSLLDETVKQWLRPYIAGKLG